jgi:hypothetical protein
MTRLEMVGVRVFLVAGLPYGGIYLAEDGLAFINADLSLPDQEAVVDDLMAEAIDDLIASTSSV